MSRVTELLGVLTNKLDNMQRSIDYIDCRTIKMDNMLAETFDLVDAISEKEEELNAQEGILDSRASYVHYLENLLEQAADAHHRLRKKNKKLKKKIKNLTNYINDLEVAE